VTSVAENTTYHSASNGDVIRFGIDSLFDEAGPSTLTISNVVISEILVPSATPTFAPTNKPHVSKALGAGPLAGIVLGSLFCIFGCGIGGYFFHKTHGDRISQHFKSRSVQPADKKKSTQIVVQSKPKPEPASPLKFVVLDDAVVHPDHKAAPAPPARPTLQPEVAPSDHVYAEGHIKYVVRDKEEA